MKTIASILFLYFLISCSLATQPSSGSIEILNVEQISSRLVQVSLELHTEVQLSEFSVDVQLELNLGNGFLFQSTSRVQFQGTPGEVVDVMIDVGDEHLLDADVFVDVSLGNLLSVDVDLSLDLSSDFLAKLVNGHSSVFDIVSIVNSIESNVDVVQILDVQIENRSIIIDVQLQGNVDIQGGFELDVHVDLLASLGLPMLTRSVHLVFQGDLNEIQTVIIANLPIELAASLKISLENLTLNQNSDVTLNADGVFTATINQLVNI